MRISFRSKLTIAFTVVLILLAFLIVNFFYSKAHYVQRDNLRSRLIGIASTASLMLDGDKHDRLQLRSDAARPEFQELKSLLTRIRESNPGITYIYTMRRTADPDLFTFVIDEAEEKDKNGDGVIDPSERTAQIGDRYDASTYPEMKAAYQGPRADRRLQSDQWGTWLSGYAPILNHQGQPVGILGIDMAADTVRAEERVLLLYALLILAGAAICSVVAGYLLSRHFTEPIYQVLSGIERVARGELDTRIEIKRKDEIGLLGKAFNTMAQSLASSRQQLDEYNRLLAEKVRERTAELSKAQDEIILREKMAAVGSLAGGVAHEFNNLFASVRGYAELALSAEAPRQKNEALKVAVRMSERAKKITNALLTYSRDDVFEKERIDPEELLDLCLGLLKRDLYKYNIKVVREYRAVPAIWGDKNQLQHALLNIMVNARDAMSGSGGVLTVSTDLGKNDIVIQIRDSGPGIEPEMLGKLFEPFRGTKGILSGGSARYAGLGLFVALGIVKSHKGDITVESRSGEGAVFTIRLPLPARTPLEEELPLEPAKRGAAILPEDLALSHILIVDDEAEIADLLKQFLERKGFKVEVVGSGLEAVGLSQQKKYELILMDIAMPNMDGESAMLEILAHQPEAQFLVISGYSPREISPQLKDSVRCYLQKPFSLSQVSAAVFKALGFAS